MRELERLAWSAYFKCKGPVAMEKPFGPLPLEEEMPEQGTVTLGEHNLVDNVDSLAGGPGMWKELAAVHKLQVTVSTDGRTASGHNGTTDSLPKPSKLADVGAGGKDPSPNERQWVLRLHEQGCTKDDLRI